MSFLMSLFSYTCILYVLMVLGFHNIVITCPKKKSPLIGMAESPGSLDLGNSESGGTTPFLAYSQRSPVSTMAEKDHFLAMFSMERTTGFSWYVPPEDSYLPGALRSSGCRVTFLNPFLQIMFQEPQSWGHLANRQWKYVINLLIL